LYTLQIRVLNKTLELGELVQEGEETGEVVGLDWVAVLDLPERRKTALGVPASNLQPISVRK
jgi:hypothetical protein